MLYCLYFFLFFLIFSESSVHFAEFFFFNVIPSSAAFFLFPLKIKYRHHVCYLLQTVHWHYWRLHFSFCSNKVKHRQTMNWLANELKTCFCYFVVWKLATKIARRFLDNIWILCKYIFSIQQSVWYSPAIYTHLCSLHLNQLDSIHTHAARIRAYLRDYCVDYVWCI